MFARKFKAGDWVVVRSREEILASLDERGTIDGMPFMPEMLQYCGQRLRVFKAGHKTCDSTYYGLGRRMKNIVFLDDLRCGGEAHGACQARCLLFWNTAWLRHSDRRDSAAQALLSSGSRRDSDWLAQHASSVSGDGAVLYRCQATQHLSASKPIKWYDVWHYVEDVTSRNVSMREALRGLLLLNVWKLRFLGMGWSAAMGLYDRLHRFFYGVQDPHLQGRIPKGTPTPEVKLALQPGEAVRVRDVREIEVTINYRNQNRGLSYNAEIAPFCNKTFQVEQRVTRIIDEKTGKMLDLKGPCITLQGVYCEARYHPQALFCPRRIPQYLREAWLERVPGQDQSMQPGKK